MSNWFDSEMDVLRRQDLAHEMSRLHLPEEPGARSSLFSRFFGWLSRKPWQEPREAPKPVLRVGH